MTQANLILKTIPLLFVVLCSMALFSSCVVEEDDEPTIIEEEEEAVTFRVDLVKIVALDIKEAEGDGLEVYGTIGSKLKRGNLTEENPLWSKPLADAIWVRLSDLPLVASASYTVLPSNIDDSSLEVSADLFESDGQGTNAPEDLGKEAISTPLASVTSSVTFQIVLNASAGQTVQLTYSITRE